MASAGRLDSVWVISQFTGHITPQDGIEKVVENSALPQAQSLFAAERKSKMDVAVGGFTVLCSSQKFAFAFALSL